MAQKRIDIIQEFVDLYQHEEMLAFFAFRIGGPNGVAGLCRISKQKGGSAGARYLSLTFMIDAPDEGSRVLADKALSRIDDAAMRAALPAVAAVIPIPVMIHGAENYIRQVDLMLGEHVEVGKAFVTERLLPVVFTLTGMTAGAVEWWDETSPTPPNTTAVASGARTPLLGALLARWRK
jgi:hypothetical protein